MAQFDIYKNTNQSTKSSYPYLIEIQSDLLSELQTTVVIPLIVKNDYTGSQLSNLHPIIEISGTQYLGMTMLIAGIYRGSLGKNVASLAKSRDEIISSIDFMITGF